MKQRYFYGAAETLKKDLKELDEELRKNFEQRLRFIDAYVEWLKKQSMRKGKTTK